MATVGWRWADQVGRLVWSGQKASVAALWPTILVSTVGILGVRIRYWPRQASQRAADSRHHEQLFGCRSRRQRRRGPLHREWMSESELARSELRRPYPRQSAAAGVRELKLPPPDLRGAAARDKRLSIGSATPSGVQARQTAAIPSYRSYSLTCSVARRDRHATTNSSASRARRRSVGAISALVGSACQGVLIVGSAVGKSAASVCWEMEFRLSDRVRVSGVRSHQQGPPQ